MLMASRTDNEAWIEADIASPRKGPKVKTSTGRSKAPFYKVLQGMPIAVDAFKYGAIPNVTAYFLTHAHSDHYTNLSSSWKNGPIYCSEGTANLIMHMLKVDKKWVRPLPMDIPTEIPNTNGVKVTLIEANHCPGSSLFFFEGKQTLHAGDSEFKSIFIGSDKVYRYLHCGDFRASPQHVLHPCVKGKKIDHVYLDTTYLDPKYSFPPQPQVISACAELAKRISDGTTTNTKSPMNGWLTSTPAGPSSSPGTSKKMKRTLMIVGTYSIGKERIVKAIAKALKSKVYCNAQKTAILKCQTDPELHAMLTNKPLEAQVHVVPLNNVISDVLKEYVKKYQEHFDNAVAFRPTGWTFSPPAGTETIPTVNAVIAKASKGGTFSWTDLKPAARGGTSGLQIYGVPYSEHSSFVELTCFALSLQWGKMIATVNVGDAKRRDAMAKWFDKWEEGRKKNDKEHIVPYRDSEYW
ncbi:DRMBL-domain-containing protein [Cylindrobasidium torrendii FP15055 ss-10]|uniref:DRMBL-domain-containing protein n=1 Tax=Cylindrobasidium torrendii FP15055 ss-10 TaxID=1314674 RepID=A0A0D7BNY7_9AGAR|nr:DRMBL-domain-containing protein [Cylindrobasidium torrendii FP15055 ss-10]